MSEMCCTRLAGNTGRKNYANKCSAEIGDRLTTMDMGLKLEAVSLMGGKLDPHVTECSLDRGLPSYQVAPWSIQPFGHNKHVPKSGGGAVRLFMAELGPHLAQCGLGQGLLPYQVESSYIQPFAVWPQQTW